LVYSSICFLEATNISEEIGSKHPFLNIGAPFINSNKLIAKLELENIQGVEFTPVKFIPSTIPGKVNHPKIRGD